MIFVFLFLVLLIPRTEQQVVSGTAAATGGAAVAAPPPPPPSPPPSVGLADINIMSLDETIHGIIVLVKDVVSFTSELVDMITIEQRMKVTIANDFGDKDLLLVKSYEADRNNRGIKRGGIFKNVGYGDAFPEDFGTGHILPKSTSTDEFAGDRGLGIVLVYQIGGTDDYLHVLVEVRDMPQIRGDGPREEIMKIFKDPFGVFELVMGSIFKGANKATDVMSNLFLDLIGNANVMGVSPIPFDPKKAKKLLGGITSFFDIRRNIDDVKKLVDKIINMFPGQKAKAKKRAKKLAWKAKRLAKKLARKAKKLAGKAKKRAQKLARKAKKRAKKLARKAKKMAREAKRRSQKFDREARRIVRNRARKAKKRAKKLARKARKLARKTRKAAKRAKKKARRAARRAGKKIKKGWKKFKKLFDDDELFDDDDVIQSILLDDDFEHMFRGDNDKDEDDDLSETMKQQFKLYEDILMQLLQFINHKDLMDIIHKIHQMGTTTLGYGIFQDREDHTKDLDCVIENKNGKHSLDKIPKNVRRPVCTIPGSPQYADWGSNVEAIGDYGLSTRYAIDRPFLLIPETTVHLYITIFDKPAGLVVSGSDNKFDKHPDSEVNAKVISAYGTKKKGWKRKKKRKRKRILRKARTKSQKKWKKKIKIIAKRNRYPLKKVAMFIDKYGYTKKCYKKIKRKLKKMKKKRKRKKRRTKWNKKARTRSQKKWKKKMEKFVKKKRYPLKKFKKLINKYGFTKEGFKKIKKKLKKKQTKKQKKRWKKKIQRIVKRKGYSVRIFEKTIFNYGYTKKCYMKIKKKLKRMKKKRKRKFRPRSQRKWKRNIKRMLKRKKISISKFQKIINRYGYTKKGLIKIKMKIRRMKKKQKK